MTGKISWWVKKFISNSEYVQWTNTGLWLNEWMVHYQVHKNTFCKLFIYIINKLTLNKHYIDLCKVRNCMLVWGTAWSKVLCRWGINFNICSHLVVVVNLTGSSDNPFYYHGNLTLITLVWIKHKTFLIHNKCYFKLFTTKLALTTLLGVGTCSCNGKFK